MRSNRNRNIKKRKTKRKARKSSKTVTPYKKEKNKIQNLLIRISILLTLIGSIIGTIKISHKLLLNQDSYVLTKIIVTLISFLAGLGIGLKGSKLLAEVTEGFHDIPRYNGDKEELEEKLNGLLNGDE